MNWVKQLPELDLSANKYSQYGEEIIIQHIFEQIKVSNKFFVDVGAGGAGRNLSNTKLLIENGWRGLSFDMDGSPGTIKEFITPDNITSLLRKFKCPKNFDFLSVDIDSFDHDVIENILEEYRPRVICAEFNGTLDPLSCVKLQYEEGYTWDGSNKYGFSFAAGKKLMKAFDYQIVMNLKDTNIFAVTSCRVPEMDSEVTARQNKYHPINPKAIFIPA